MNRSLTRKTFTTRKKHGFESQEDSSRLIKQQSAMSPVCQVYLNGRTIIADQFHENDGSMATLMQILVFCNENINHNRIHENLNLEKSLLDFAASKGFHKKLFDKIVPKIAEIKINGDPGTASAIIGLNGRFRLVIKDQPERLLSRSDKFLFKGRAIPLTMNMIAKIQKAYHQMTFNNLTVIMLAFKDIEKLPFKLSPVFQTGNLTLVGMIGLRDSVYI